MLRAIWNTVFIFILSLPNIVWFSFDPTSTKLSALLLPIIFFTGLSRLVSTYRGRFFLGLPFILFSFVSLNILVQFNSQITEIVIDAVLRSDLVEGVEFIKETIASAYWTLFLYMLGCLFLFFKAKTLDSGKSFVSKKRFWVTGILILLPIVDAVGKGASGHSYPFNIARNTYYYSVEKSVMQDLLKQREDFRFNATVKDKSGAETFIFVVGETSRRDFNSLYGYSRETNPNLKRLDDLLVFNDAISPANATVPSLKAVLHLSTAEDDSQFFHTKSIVSLAKEAGYKTWWLSTQSKYGKYDTSVSSSGVDSDVKWHLENRRSLRRTFDGALIPFLKKGLDDVSSKKFIVMHLYGSHLSYVERYPESFSKFDGVPKGYESRTAAIQNKVNQYANSIRYTDSVLSEVIKAAQLKKTPTCVVYSADHGEYLADYLDNDSFGHGGALPYKREVEVPLFVWCSKQYIKQNPEKWQAMMANREQPINTEDMFYSLSDLLQINYDLMRPERSFFSQYFSPQLPRKTRSALTGRVFNYRELR